MSFKNVLAARWFFYVKTVKLWAIFVSFLVLSIIKKKCPPRQEKKIIWIAQGHNSWQVAEKVAYRPEGPQTQALSTLGHSEMLSGRRYQGHALTVTDNRGYQAAGARASSPSWCHLITWGRQEPYFRNIHMYIYICIVLGLKPLASFSAFSFGDSFVLNARQACSLDPMSDRKLWTPGLESPEHVTRGNLRMSFKHR